METAELMFPPTEVLPLSTYEVPAGSLIKVPDGASAANIVLSRTGWTEGVVLVAANLSMDGDTFGFGGRCGIFPIGFTVASDGAVGRSSQWAPLPEPENKDRVMNILMSPSHAVKTQLIVEWR